MQLQYKAMVVHLVLLCLMIASSTALIPLPSFAKMRDNYPGYKHAGGRYYNNKLINMIGCKRDLLLHDTSALRLSYSFNKVGGEHSLGKDLIHLSRNGIDSVSGKDGHQYIYHPIAYGPFLADKYGYPSISKLHQLDPISTRKTFWGKQGILRIITYRKIKNLPVGHVALWDCDHFHETKDWISGHSLITAEFWESPDSNCSRKLNPTSEDRSQKSALQSLTLKSTNKQPIQTSSSSSPHVDHHLPVQSYQQSAHQLPVQSTHQLPVPTDHLSTNILQINQGNKAIAYNSKVGFKTLLQYKAFRKQFIKKHYASNGHLRHAKHRGLILSNSHHRHHNDKSSS